MADRAASAIGTFITRWQSAGGSERANYQLFVPELSALLGLPRPIRRAKTRATTPMCSSAASPSSTATAPNPWLHRLLPPCGVRARSEKGQQATRARVSTMRCCAPEGRPSSMHAPFPPPKAVHRSWWSWTSATRSSLHRVHSLRCHLHAVSRSALAPHPARPSARRSGARAPARAVARSAVARPDAAVRQSHTRDRRAAGRSRAGARSRRPRTGNCRRVPEPLPVHDVRRRRELLPKRSFRRSARKPEGRPEQFVPHGGRIVARDGSRRILRRTRAPICSVQRQAVQGPRCCRWTRDQIELLLEAARANWREVSRRFRHAARTRARSRRAPCARRALHAARLCRAAGAADHRRAVARGLEKRAGAALVLARRGQARTRRRELSARVPRTSCATCACSIRRAARGNFLYVTLEHLKRLEGEVLEPARRTRRHAGRLELQGVTVDPHQLLGIELNPRAAEIAEMVLWIGYLQWHFRTRGQSCRRSRCSRISQHRMPRCRARLRPRRIRHRRARRARLALGWKTMKKHPVTVRMCRTRRRATPVERYVNPRKAEWPAADFVIGNPPFIGTSECGMHWAMATWKRCVTTWKEVPESADFVMYWWHNAANSHERKLVASG